MSFQALTECLNPGERLRIELAVEGETLTVLIQPLLKAASVQQSDEQLKLRAGLAHPLRLSASASDLDASLISSLTAYGEKRRALQASANELESLDEAIRQAQQTVHGKRRQATQTGTSPAPSMDETASDAANAAPSAATLEPALAVPETANPDSLF